MIYDPFWQRLYGYLAGAAMGAFITYIIMKHRK
jgi:hypothetical protein